MLLDHSLDIPNQRPILDQLQYEMIVEFPIDLPSSPKSLTNCTADLANLSLPAGVEAGCAKFEEYVQPPIDSNNLLHQVNPTPDIIEAEVVRT